MKKSAAVSALLVALALAGCSSYGPEELDRLTKEDPEFKQMIAARDRMNTQIRLIKDDLLKRKQAANAEIARRRAEYDTFARAESIKIEKYRAVIDAHRNELKREVETSAARLEAKEAELDRLKKSREEVEKVLSQSGEIALSKPEREKWEERRLLISEKIRPLEDEIAETKAAIRLNKRKISFLR